MQNWKTTTTGILTILSTLIPLILSWIKTGNAPDMTVLGPVLAAGVGLIFAKDATQTPVPPVVVNAIKSVPLIAVLAAFCLPFGCATDPTGNAQTDRRNRIVNALLIAGENALGSAASAALQNVANSEIQGKKVDFGSAASQGVYAASTSVLSSNTIADIVKAFSGNQLPQTATAAQSAFNQAVAQGIPPEKAADGVASVIGAVATQATPVK